MPPIDLPRGNAAKPPPKPAPLTLPQLNQNVSQFFAAHPAAPVVKAAPKPAPAVNLRTAANPRGVAIAPAPKPTINDLQATARAKQSGSDVLTGGYGGNVNSVVNAYKQTPQYKQTVLDVFKAQNPTQRQAVVAGALKQQANPNPAARSPEGKMVLDYVKQTGQGSLGSVNDPGTAAIWGSVLRAQPADALGKFGVNFAKDLVNYVPGTLQGLWSTGVEGAKAISAGFGGGDWSSAAKHAENVGKMEFGGYAQMAEHPTQIPQMAFEHPLNTGLMVLGALAGAGELSGALMRSGALGESAAAAASTTRTPLSLGTVSGEPTPAPLVEERSYSSDITRKGLQVAREKYVKNVKGQNPNIAGPAPRGMPQGIAEAFNLGREAKLRRIGNEMAHTQQVLSRAERNRINGLVEQARPQDKAAEPIVTHFLQSAGRNPETAVGDLNSEAQRLQTARTHTTSQHNEWNKMQVQDIHNALATPLVEHPLADGSSIMLPRAVSQAITAAEKLRPIINEQDRILLERGILSPDQVVAKYFPYAQKHMGAIYDWNMKWLKNAQYPEGLPISAIQQHLAGWRDVANPDFIRASRVRENADRVLAQRQAEHNAATAEYRAAVENHRNATNISQGQPTALEIQKLVNLRALRDRPGTPGEGAAAQAAVDRIEAKIRERGGTPADPAVLQAAEQRLAAANTARQGTRARFQAAREGAQRARAAHEATPETVSRQVEKPVPEPAFVEHSETPASASEYFKRYDVSRGSLNYGKRTGEAFRLGGYDHTYEGLNGQMALRGQKVAQAGIHDRVIQRSFLKPKAQVNREVAQEWAKARDAMQGKGPVARARITAKTQQIIDELKTGMYTQAEADKIAYAQPRDPLHNVWPSELQVVPIRNAPVKTSEAAFDLQDPIQMQNIHGTELRALESAMAEAKDSSNQARNVVLAPKVLIDQLRDQYAPGGMHDRLLARGAQQFRNTVLPYSTHWMAQIGTEALLRTLFTDPRLLFDPRYRNIGKGLEQRLGQTEPGQAAAAEITGATFGGQQSTLGIYHSPNAAIRFLQDLWGTKHVIQAHKWWVSKIGETMYGLERTARQAGLGKLAKDHVREIREFGDAWQKGPLKTQGQIIEAVAHDLETNPALVAKFGRQIDNLFGQYGKYSPSTRAWIQSYMPFLPWCLTAAKYVFWQLPVHHPVTSGLLASMRTTVNQDIKDGKTTPLNAYALQALGTLGPFGIFTPESGRFKDVAKEIVEKAASLPLPGLSGAGLALAGRTPFWTTLKGPGGTVAPMSLTAMGQAASSFAEAMAPGLTRLRYLTEGGQAAYGTSKAWDPQVKPGGAPWSAAQVANRELNPFYSLMRQLNATPGGVVTTSAGRAPKKARWGGAGSGRATGGWGGPGSGGGGSSGWGGPGS